MKRMALGLLFGFVLGFASTVIVSLALGGEGPSPSPVSASLGPTRPFLPGPVKALSKPLKFSCDYVTYTSKHVDFQQTKYVCSRRGAGPTKEQLRSLVHFSAGGSGSRGVGLDDEFVDGSGRYRVVRVEPAPNVQGFDHVWAELIKRLT